MLKIENLSKVFNAVNNEDKKVALNHVSLTVNEGDFITVIGGNGSGKTTLLNLIAGVYDVSEGIIQINDIDVTKMKEHKRAKYLGRVFQDPSMGTAGNMSIEENMAIALRRDCKKTLKWGFSKENETLFINTLSSLNLGLEKRLKQKVSQLSGGQRQALTLIMATLKQPKLLLLDEHTAALDPKTAATVLDLTQKIVNEQKITTLMITHNMKDALKYGNRLIMLNNGEIILDINQEEKKNLTIERLLEKFNEVKDIELNDKLILV